MARMVNLWTLCRFSIINSLRTAIATVISLLVARGLRLGESYWAPISTIVILLSTIHPRTNAWQRFVGTALGAVLGAFIATHFPATWIVYGAGVLLAGIICAILRIPGAYRLAAITLTIVLLVAHSQPPWIIALHRFIEVSLGIAIGLLATVLWPIKTADAS